MKSLNIPLDKDGRSINHGDILFHGRGGGSDSGHKYWCYSLWEYSTDADKGHGIHYYKWKESEFAWAWPHDSILLGRNDLPFLGKFTAGDLNNFFCLEPIDTLEKFWDNYEEGKIYPGFGLFVTNRTIDLPAPL